MQRRSVVPPDVPSARSIETFTRAPSRKRPPPRRALAPPVEPKVVIGDPAAGASPDLDDQEWTGAELWIG
ncbi:MAG TPA: hypothetical protein VF129_00965 [Actinomycetota bacterium]